MKQRATIKDIAVKVNLHYTTVSRALRNHPDVQPATKKIILDAAKELKYQPNIHAQNLKTKQSRTIGVIVPEIKHDFFSSVISGIEDLAYEAGYVILLLQSNEKYEREVQNTKALITHDVEGLLVSISQETKNADHLRMFMQNGGSLVCFDRVCDDLVSNKVVVNDYDGAYKATQHLIERGYTKIAHLGGERGISITEARYNGYLDALKKNNLNIVDDYVYFGGFHELNGKDGMKNFLKLPETPDAVFAVNDPVAIGAYGAIKSRGLRIPDDVAMVGYSNNPVGSMISPSLTTVHQPAYQMGKMALELLFKQINNRNDNYKPERKVLETSMIVREST
jgi:DNA-binding LacI/PurR family transcriptional regulator